MKNSKILALALLTVFSFSSCNNDDPEVVNEEEVITTVTTTLTAGSSVITLTSRDLDGDGPKAPVVTVSGNLKINTTYTGATTFLNETVTPADDITVEVKEEGDEHQLFYQAPVAVGTFTYTDTDKNGKPIGLTFTLKTGAAATTGNITVVLRHLPAKSASGVAAGDITNAGGATDALVTFPVAVVN
ncbi:type 1 periplasmic binding fold superfamily protein [Flavobacterium sp. RSSA_27]|uniref:type 1 periplasmic binding fold superfamily protein n=1 Tax=Flavobacterium sp. RSSA_27 TaxID=3447667 RepID=UPI003F2D321C